MFSLKTSLVFATVMGAIFAADERYLRNNGGGRGRDGDRGAGGGGRPSGDFFGIPSELVGELTCTTEETFECAFRRNSTGILACRSWTTPDGLASFNKTLCVNPAMTSIEDTCGCCDGACPTECSCECNEGEGYWIEPERRNHYHNSMDGEEDEDTEDDFKMIVCAPKLKAVTAVAEGRASCACPV